MRLEIRKNKNLKEKKKKEKYYNSIQSQGEKG